MVESDSDERALGVVGGGLVGGLVAGDGDAAGPGVVEAGVATGQGGVAAVATEDDDTAQEAEPDPDPTGVQREPERHEAFRAVGPDGKPYGGDDAKHSHDDVERSPDARAVEFVGGGVVLESHTGHGHEHQQQSGQPQQTGRDHQGTRRLDVRWQSQYLVE